MCLSTVSSNKVSPPCLFFSQLLPSGGTEPGEGRGLKGHFSSGSPALFAASGRAVEGVGVAEVPSEALGAGARLCRV